MTQRSARVRRRLVPMVILLVVVTVGLGLLARLMLDFSGGAGAPFTGGGLSGAPVDDGEIPVGERVSVFDVDRAAVANLDPELLAAIQRAATDAAVEDIPFFVTSGWRSPEYQARLLSEAEQLYASAEEARRWVATPDTSLHVSGDAIDIGDFDAAYWLSLNGARYGLCQIYANEIWHFELRPEAVTAGCPEQYLDPTHDPRMG